MTAMKPKQILKICVDIAMMVALLLLMTYELIGQATHEWLGVGIFALWIAHHLLNLHWYRNLFRGRYMPYRTVQTVIVLCILLTMLGSMLSGIVLSQTVFSFVRIRGLSSIARAVHMLSAYWGFLLMSLHLGLHWSVFVKILGKRFPKKSVARTWALRWLVLAAALYGCYAFHFHGIGRYLFLIDHFVFFDFSLPLYRFLLDYAAMAALPAAAGYYLSKGLLIISKKTSKNNGGSL